MEQITDLSMNSRIVQVKKSVESNMDGEKVMFSLENGKYYNLGAVGGNIWDLLQQPMMLRDVITSLLQTYEVTQEMCEEHVISFIKSLKSEGLIDIVSE